MDKPRIWTAEEADALRAAATPGPWRWRSFPDNECDAIWSGPDVGDGAVCVLDLGDDEPYDARCGEVYDTGSADLLAAAPDLAASVAHHARRADAAEAENKRLRDLVQAAYREGWSAGEHGAGFGNIDLDWLHSTACAEVSRG